MTLIQPGAALFVLALERKRQATHLDCRLIFCSFVPPGSFAPSLTTSFVTPDPPDPNLSPSVVFVTRVIRQALYHIHEP